MKRFGFVLGVVGLLLGAGFSNATAATVSGSA